MASGVALRESVKEMKRLKNEPLLMLAIIAIILFVGFFVVYPVIRVITFPSGQDYMQLFQKARWFTALKNSLFMTLISTVSCTAMAAVRSAAGSIGIALWAAASVERSSRKPSMMTMAADRMKMTTVPP